MPTNEVGAVNAAPGLFMNRRLLLVCLLPLVLLAGCVTQTSGGFAVESSREQALRDYIRLAFGYYEADDMVLAKRHVDNAMALDRRSSEAHHVRALIHVREGEPALAEQTFEQALRLDRNNSRARNNYAVFLYGREDFERAYEHLELVAADTAYESRPLAFLNLGLAAQRSGREARAMEAFERALLLDRNMVRAALSLAQGYYERGEFAQAIRYYQQFEAGINRLGLAQTAESLWLGVALAERFDDREQRDRYGSQLREEYADSAEYRRYLELDDTTGARP